MNESEAYLMRQRREAAGYVAPVTGKRCSHCRQWKDRADFPVSRMVSDGLASWCRACKAEGVRAWRAKQKEAGR